MRRALFFDANFDSGYGAQRSMLALARGLRSRLDIVLVTTDHGELERLATRAGLSIRIVQASGRINTFGGGIRISNPIRLFLTALDVLSYNTLILRVLRETKTDIVIANDLRSLLLVGLGSRAAKVPVVWHVRDDIRRGHLHKAGTWLASLVVTVSDGVRQVFTAGERTRAAAKFRTVRTGIPPTSFLGRGGDFRKELDIGDETLVVVTVGMLAPRKGQFTFLEVAEALSASIGRPLCFLIVGHAPDGYEDYAASLSKAARSVRLKAGDNLHLLGHRADVGAIMDAADLLLHPATNEGLPRVLLEALQHGTTIVTYDVSGAREVISSGVEGEIVRVGDSPGMIAAARSLLLDDVRREEMGKAGQRRVASAFSVERYVGEYLDALTSMLTDVRRR